MLEHSYSAKKAISISYVQVIADLVEARGGNKKQLLKKVGVDQQSFGNFFSLITFAQYEMLLQEAVAITQDPALGLYIGRNLKFGSHGTFAFAALSFPTAWAAINVGQKFSKLCNRIVEIQMEEGHEFNTIRIETAYFSDPLYQTVIEIVMGTFCEIFHLKFNGNISGIEIDLRYGEPRYGEQYRDVFKLPIRFETAANEIRIPKWMANKPLAMADPITATKFEEECDELIAQIEEPKEVSQLVREALFISKDGFPLLDDMTSQFNMSPRTLRRRLQESGTSYKNILGEVRLEIAQRYLTTTQRSIGAIAFLLG